LEVQDPVLKSVATAAGRALPILGSVSLPLKLFSQDGGTVETLARAQVLHTLIDGVDLILGLDFWHAHQVEMGFKNGTVQCTVFDSTRGERIVLSRKARLHSDKQKPCGTEHSLDLSNRPFRFLQLWLCVGSSGARDRPC
jgi:hypothetical protein